MAAEPSWIALAAPSATIFISIGAIFWSRARTSGQDSTKLETVCADIAAQKKITADHEKTLATHTALHEQHAGDIEDFQRRMLKAEQSIAQMQGRMDPSRQPGRSHG